MALQRLRKPLVRLSILLIRDENDGNEDQSHPYWIYFPEDLIGSYDLQDGTALHLTPETTKEYFDCLSLLEEEQRQGDLEYLKPREIKTLLDRFTCTTWLERSNLNLQLIPKHVKTFISEHAHPPVKWDVACVIENVSVEAPIEVANARFFRMEREDLITWIGNPDHIREHDLAEIGKTYASVQVTAGYYEHAVIRGRQAIEDAVSVFRVAALGSRYAIDEQLRQHRGAKHFAREVVQPGYRYWGSKTTFGPFQLEARNKIAEAIQQRANDLQPAFNNAMPVGIQERLQRAILWVGSSLDRTSYDDRIVDLCTALESILTLQGDKRKAEAIALRYTLLLIASGKARFRTHPLEIYNLYELRSRIVHGSARLIGTADLHRKLRFVAMDAINCFMAYIQEHPDTTTFTILLDEIKADPHLSEAILFLEQWSGDEAEAVLALGRQWQHEAATKNATVDQSGVSFRTSCSF